MRLVLRKLGLKVNEEDKPVPSLSRLHLSAHSPAEVADLVASWGEIITVVDGEEYLQGGNDVFRLDREGSTWGVQGLKKAIEKVGDALPSVITGKETEPPSSPSTREGPSSPTAQDNEKAKSPEERIRGLMDYGADTTIPDVVLDYDKIIKSLFLHTTSLPSTRETPTFHHESYYANLVHHHSKAGNHSRAFGRHLVYGEVVTSTNTLLEKNASLLQLLPTGFTVTATTQLAGRGRGANVWVAPPGALMFSTVIHHPFTLTQSAPVIFIQYLAALAVVRGIKTYAPGYDRLDVKLKWPNDMYVQLPGSPRNPLVKIGGVLVNSSYTGSSYAIVLGIGLNLSNPLPTTSLNSLVPTLTSPALKPLTQEKLLASILACFESLYTDFCRLGWSKEMEKEYYASWLHGDQVVSLETEEASGLRARIKGITRDWGLLLAEELGWEDRPTGKMVALQSDSNSFDFFRGLIRRKL